MKHYLLFFLAWVICAFGQPAWSPFLSLLASAGGYALIFHLALQIDQPKKRFLLGFAWFAAVQAVQFSWFLSHPFYYIYAVYAFLLLLYGAQFGLLCLWLTPARLKNPWSCFIIPSFWVLMEWSRLFILSGTSWNPIGLSLAANNYTLQAASLVGVFGFSFWVIFTSLLLVRKSYIPWLLAVGGPFVFGWVHLHTHEKRMQDSTENIQALLVQTAFPVEETLHFSDRGSYLRYVLSEWKQILTLIAPHQNNSFDFVAVPEMVVPFGTYSPMYSYDTVIAVFKENFGNIIHLLPKAIPPFADTIDGHLYVNNAFFAQAIANILNTSLIIGLEDAEHTADGQREMFSAALHFRKETAEPRWPPAERYEKRVLVPMGEYIPSAYLTELAKSYGVYGSFTPGTCAKTFQCARVAVSPTICYDETYGNMTRKCAGQGAQALVNLTSDAWFPHLNLVWQHMEHARLRTVETGLPLFRACNTGITCAIDSLGRTQAVLGAESDDPETLSAALAVSLPKYNYSTLYAKFGDQTILAIALIFLFSWAVQPITRSILKKIQ